MRSITCSPVSSIEPKFQGAFEIFFVTGQDSPGFAAHVLEHPVREDEVIMEAKGLASELEGSGQLDLGQRIRQALPQEPQGIKPGTPAYRKFKRMQMEGAPWEPTLNVGQLGEAIAAVRQRLGMNVEVSCANCGDTVTIPAGQTSAHCSCGQEITTAGDILRVGH